MPADWPVRCQQRTRPPIPPQPSRPGVSSRGPVRRGARHPDPKRWLILGVIALAQLMVVLDATIVNIALPSAQRSLHFSTWTGSGS